MVEIPRNRIPNRAQMFRISTAEILRRADILGRRERFEEIVVVRTVKRTFAVHSGLADHARLVDVEILEAVVEDAVGDLVPIMMAVRATRPAR